MERFREYKPSSSFRWPFSLKQSLFLGLLTTLALWSLGGAIVSALVLSGVGVPAGIMLAFMLTSHLSHTGAIIGVIANSFLALFLGGYTGYLANRIYQRNKYVYSPLFSYSSYSAIATSATYEEPTCGKPSCPRFNLLDRLRGCCKPDEFRDGSSRLAGELNPSISSLLN